MTVDEWEREWLRFERSGRLAARVELAPDVLRGVEDAAAEAGVRRDEWIEETLRSVLESRARRTA